MLHTFLLPPFADPTCQAQFEAVQAALEAESDAPVSLLIGNFAVEEGGEVYDAVLVRPHSVTVLLFVPGGGLLDISPATPSIWQLGGQPLHLASGAINPFGQFRRMKEALADWLVSQLGPGHVAPELITGLALFSEPVTFGPGVEQYLHKQSGADSFQLVHNTNQFVRRLRQVAHPEIQLSNAELTDWAQDLAAEHPETPEALSYDDQADSEGEGYWQQKARQLWHWLGAEDVPHDAPYGSAAATVAASSEEKQHLEELRQQVRLELSQQRQETEAREAEREASISRLRAQLAQAPTPNSAELEARLATETREKAALEEAIRVSRADAAVRNQELDARIQQLGQLIEQFQTRPTATLASAAPISSILPQRPAKRVAPANLFQRPTSQLRLSRAALVGATAAGLGFGIWGLTQVPWGSTESKEPTRYSSVNTTPHQEAADESGDTTAPLDSLDQEVVPVVEDSTASEEQTNSESIDSPIIETATDATHDTLRLEPENSPMATDSVSTPAEQP